MDINEIQSNILDSLLPNPHGRLLLSPRVGKTKLIIELIKRDKPKSILWVTPSAKLAEEDIPNEFDKWKAKRYKKRLTTVTYASLNKTTGHYSWIILDEDQCVTENALSTLFDKSLTYQNIIGMTGTDTTHADKQFLYSRLNLSVLVEYDINTAVSDQILSDYHIYVVDIPLDANKNILVKTKAGKTFYTSELNTYNYYNNKVETIKLYGGNMKRAALMRMKVIHKSNSKASVVKWLGAHLKGRSLIFAPTIKQIESITSNVYHSKTNKDAYNAFQENKINTLGLVESGGIGHTFTNLNNIILMQVDSDGTGRSTQKICRALLAEKDKFASIYIMRLVGTQDVNWVNSTLSSFDKSKVSFLTLNDLIEHVKNQSSDL